MNKTAKKVMSLVLMIIMVLSSVPMTTFAANTWCSIVGHDMEWKVTKAATCTVSGEETYTCTREGCGYTEGSPRTTAVLAHTLVTIPAADPTCDKVGNTEGSYCSVCTAVIKECENIPAVGHKPVEFAAKDATCTENGNKAGTKCSVCDKVLTGGAVVAASGHDLKLVNYKAGSCTSEGWEIWECKSCGEENTKYLEAEHNFAAWTTTKAATCSAAGSMKRTCRDCGVSETKTIDQLAHTEVAVAAKAPTCAEAGATAGKKCSVCNAITDGCDDIPATGHKEVIVNGTAATCGVKGKSDGAYCEYCKEILRDQVEIAALEHILVEDAAASIKANCSSEGKKVEKCTQPGCVYTKETVIPKTHEVNWIVNKEATCTEAGTKSGYCTACKQTVVESIPATGHEVKNALSWKTKTPATCTADGEMVAECSKCDGQATKVIPKTGHQETTYKPAVAPTCTAVGYTESKQCSVCKKVTVEAEIIEKVDHTYGEWTETKTATCAAAGVAESVCTVCKQKQLKTIDRLPHTEEAIPAVDPTCTAAGSTAGINCTVCKAKVKEVEEIPALGHDYIEDASQHKDATCTEEGKFYGKCSRCEEIKDEVIPALGHTEEVIPGTPADCTLDGISDGKKCTVCNAITVEQATIPALGHDFVVDTVNSKPATCTEKGYDYLNCSRCKVVDERETAPLEHTWGEWTVTTEPSCDTQGEQTRICSVCNTIDDQKIDSLGGHTVATLPGYEATCTEPGKTNGTYCEKCNTIFEAQEDIPAYGHDIDDAEPILEKATTEKDGSYAVHCETCNEAIDPKVIPQIDEASIKLSTAKCTYNGKKRTPSVTVKDVNGDALVKDTDYTVTYESGRKNPGEYKITVDFIGNYEGTKTLIFTIAAGKTSKITATSAQKDYVKLSWNAVEGATGYRVYVYKTVDGKTRKKVASVTGTTYNLKKDYAGDAIAVGSEYKIAIVAYTKLEDGTVIHALAGVAKTFTRTPGKPSLTVTSASGKANLKWTNVEDETGYQIYYATSKNGEYVRLASTSKNTYAKAFTKGKTIYFKVRAYAKVDGETVYGSFSAVKSVVIK